MSFFYDLNKKLNGIGAEQKKLAESKEAPKTPARQTLEQALRQDLTALMEGQVNEISQSTKDSYAKKAKAEVNIYNRNKNNPAPSPKDKEMSAMSAARREKGLARMTKEDGTGGANFSGSGSLEEKKEKWIQKATKPSTKGDLHKALHVPQGEKIPKGKISKATHSKDAHLRHMAQFAKNVAKEDGGSEMECDNPTPSKGIPGNVPVPGKMDRLRGKRDYYEADHSEEDIMDYLNRKLAPHDKEQAREDAVATSYNKGTGKPDAHNGMEFEGNAFTGKLKSTPKGGKFKVGGEEYTDTSELDEAVSRKHFQAIADTLKHIEDMNKRKELAQHHASAFKLANPRFDQARFFKAAGITDEGIAGQAAGTLAGGALGGPVGAAIGGAIGNNLTGDGAVEEGFDDMDAWLKQREAEKGTGKFDKRKTSTGTVYTRKPETFDEPDASDDSGSAVKRGRGRPAGTKGATGSRGPTGKSKLMSKGSIREEGDHVCSECGQMIAEKSKSQAQAHMMAGVAHNPKFAKKVGIKQSVGKEFNKADKGKDISKLPKKVKKTEEGKGDGNLANNAKPYDKVTKGDVIAGRLGKDEEGGKKKFKKEEKVDETTTSGSVATSAPKAAKSGGMKFGGGIYDSWNRDIEAMISESVQVKQQVVEHAEDGDEEAITITATGADVHRIKELLAAMGIQSSEEGHSHDDGACGTCGGVPCQCDEMNDMEEGVKGAIAGAALGSVAGPLGAVAGGYAGDKIGDYVDDKLNSAPAAAPAASDPTASITDTSDEEEIAEADAPVTQNSPDYPSNQEYDDDALQYSGGLNGPKSTGQSTIPVLASQDERQVSEASSFLNLYKAFAKIVK